MARILIVGGGCRGLALAGTMALEGHAVRISTRSEAGRAAIEATGAECWIGTPDRIATLRGALDRVTVACWLLGNASGDADRVGALHGTRLEYWLTSVIDTTVRGLVYETRGSVAAARLAEGTQLVRSACARSSIPLSLIEADPADTQAWGAAARASIASLLGPPAPMSSGR